VECLTIGEAPAQPNIFKTIDHDHGNKDGKLSAEEVGGWFKKEQGDKDKDAHVKELMKQEDKDKDGFISWEEFSGPKGDKAEL
jgi:FK506-binding protein 14